MSLTLQRVGFAVVFSIATLAMLPTSSYAQIGNSISGFVFGVGRTPVADAEVELLNEFGQTMSRTRTSGSGQYMFNSLGAGNFIVRVRPFMTDYLEQEQPIQIVSMVLGNNNIGGTNEYKDIYLKLRPGVNPAMVLEAIFVQEVPDAAKKLYNRALAELADKRTADAYASLKAALDIFPRYHAALEKLGTEYLRLGTPAGFQAAEILLKLATDVYPKGYRSWYGLAGALFHQKKYDAALTAIQKANELNSGVSDAAILTGRLLRIGKKYADAEKQFLRARELSNNSNTEVNWQLAQLYGLDLQRYDDAVRELRAYLRAKPDAANATQVNKLIADFEARALAAKKPAAPGT